MKRKVIRQGNGTLTITLPKVWVDRHGVKGGDEIEVGERGPALSISTEEGKGGLSVSMDLGMITNPKSVRWILSGLHKRGCDEIELFYQHPDTLKAIQEQAKNLYVGFVIMEQSNKRVLLRAISTDSYAELEPSLRRAFLVTLTLGESMLEKFKKKEFDTLHDLLPLEKSNNQFVNFCERLLAKHGFEVPEKTCFKYIIVWNIEKVCDCYKDLCAYVEEQHPKELPPQLLTLCKEVLQFTRSFYNLVYTFDAQGFDALVKESAKLSAALERYEPKKKYEHRIVHILEDIVERCMNFSGSLIAMTV